MVQRIKYINKYPQNTIQKVINFTIILLLMISMLSIPLETVSAEETASESESRALQYSNKSEIFLDGLTNEKAQTNETIKDETLINRTPAEIKDISSSYAVDDLQELIDIRFSEGGNPSDLGNTRDKSPLSTYALFSFTGSYPFAVENASQIISRTQSTSNNKFMFSIYWKYDGGGWPNFYYYNIGFTSISNVSHMKIVLNGHAHGIDYSETQCPFLNTSGSLQGTFPAISGNGDGECVYEWSGTTRTVDHFFFVMRGKPQKLGTRHYYGTLEVVEINHNPVYVPPPTSIEDISTWNLSEVKNNVKDIAADLGYQISAISCTQEDCGDPINTRTGAFSFITPDISIPTSAGNLVFQRAYSSSTSSVYSDLLGYGWTHNHDTHLIFPDDPGGMDDYILYKDLNGNQYIFADKGDGSFQSAPGVLSELTRSTSSPYTYTLTTPEKAELSFDESGQLISRENVLGIGFSYTYDADAKLTHVSADNDTRYFDLAYDSQDRIISVTDHTGREISYGYDTAGDLISVVDLNSETWTYVYDSSHRITQALDPNGNQTVRNEYDTEGKVVQQYDGKDDLVVEIVYNTDGTTTVYDAEGNFITNQSNELNLITKITNELGEETNTDYDENFRPVSVTNAVGHTLSMEWSEDGKYLLAETDPEGNRTEYTYDDEGRLLSETDPEGNTQLYTYTGDLLTSVEDAEGDIITYSYTEDGLLSLQTDSEGKTISYDYDEHGQRTSTTNWKGNTTSYVYDEIGNLVETVSPQGLTTRNEYNAAGQLLRTIENYDPARGQNDEYLYNITTEYTYDITGNLITETDTYGRVTRYVYDNNGRRIRTINAAGNVTHYEYNELGQRTAVTDANGNRTRYVYDPTGRLLYTINSLDQILETTTFDSASNTASVTDTDGNTYTYYYNEVNQIVRIVNPLGDETATTYTSDGSVKTSTDELGRTTTYEYDQLGRLIRTTSPGGAINQSVYDSEGNRIASIDPLGNQTTYTYDENNRLIHTTDPLGNQTTNVYDEHENLVEYIDVLGHSTHYEYDEWDRKIAQTDPDGDRTTYTYDILGRVVSTTSPQGTSTTTYDALGRRTAWTDEHGRQATNSFDELDRVVSSTDYEGRTTTNSYDAVGNLLSTTNSQGNTTTYTYDALNRKVSSSDALGNTNRVVYNAAGQISDEINANGIITHYEYDVLGRKTAVILNHRPEAEANADTNVRVEYTYNAVGNITAVKDANGNVTQFEYDSLNRLVRKTDPLGNTWVNTYDLAGNLVSKVDGNGAVTHYSYDAAENLLLVDYPDPDADVSFTYDAAGRRTGMTDGLGTTTWTYNNDGRVLTVSDPYEHQLVYTYSDEGDCIGVEYFDGKRVGYIYDYNHSLTGVTDWDEQTTEYEYDPLGQIAAVTLPNGISSTYSLDELGRLSGLEHQSDQSELSGYEYTYDALGNVVKAVENVSGASYGPTVQITLTDTAGDPLSAKEVYAYKGEEYSGYHRQTDENGLVSITLPEGTYRFKVNIDGTEFWSAAENHCEIGDCGYVTMTIPQAVLVSVLDSDNLPQVGLRVYAYNGEEYTQYFADTDENGQVSLRLPEGEYRFRSDFDGTRFWSAEENHCTVPGCTNAEILISKPLVVSVLDDLGEPKTGLNVYAYAGDTYTGFSARTDENGEVQFTLPEGEYRFRADYNGTQFWSASENHCALPGCTEAVVTVSLPLTVTVTDTEGNLVSNASVYVYSAGTYQHFTGKTNENGEVQFTLPQGDYRFRADYNGTQFWSAGEDHCSVPGCTAASVVVTRPVLVSVLNTTGTPQVGLNVYVFSGTAYQNYNARTDENGEVQFTLPQGDYRFRADLNGTQFWSSTANDCSIPGNTTAQVSVTIPVQVLVQDTDGEGLANIRVYAYSGTSYSGYQKTSGSDGLAVFTLPEGDYRFRADVNGEQIFSGSTNHCSVPGCDLVSIQAAQASTNTPLPSQTKTQTLTPTPTATATAEATQTYSVTPTLVFTHTATATIQATDVQTKTPTATPTTVVPEDTPTPTLTHTEAADTPVPSFTPTPTFTATATQEGDGGQGSLLHQLASILSIPLPDLVNVEVQVENTDGQAQAGLTVYAFDGSTYTGVSAVTNVNGKATLSLPDGNYRFRADLNGTQFWSSTENNCTIPSCSIATIFVSKPLQVSVVDTDGEARSGLNVYAFDGTTYSGYSKTTDENGQAVFTLPQGDYHFRADLNGTQFWSSTANNCSLPGCESTQVVVTKPLTVTVSDSAGTPKAGLPVYAFDGAAYTNYSKTTDENGQAVFTLPQGDYRFRADLNGTHFWSDTENHCTLPGCSTAVVEVALPLTLTVLDTDGTPQNGVAVYAFDGTTYSNYSKTTDENGQAVFTLPQGSYRFRADLNSTQFWSSPQNHCDIPGTTSLSLTVNKVLTLSVLNSNGEGMPDIHVYAFDGNTYTGYSQITDENGIAFFTLPDGSYRFRADLNGTQFWSSENNNCTLPGCESARVTLSLPLMVTVQDTDGTPQAGLNVYAFDGQTYTNYNALTDENGQAVFSLPEGDYRFRADLNGTQFWSSAENHCTLPGCEGVSLSVSKPVQVTVSGETGYAYEGLSVYAFSDETYSGYCGMTDANGKLSFTLPEGDYRFRADYDGVQFWSGSENTCSLPGCEEDAVILPGGSGERRVTIDYTYDALYRLTSVVYSDGTSFEYVYDAAGNVLSALAPAGTSSSETIMTEYTYDSANQLNTAVEDGVTWYYSYDGNGSLVQTDPGSEAAGAKRYTYNTAGYLTKVETHTGNTWEGQAEMKYDGLGNRLEMNTFSGSETLTTYYQVDEGQTVAVIGPENTTYYLLGLDVLATYRDGWSYILPDGTGTSRQLVNAEGEVTLSISYTPWGDTLAIYGSGDLDLGYLGGIYDETTGLIYVGSGQYYDPHTGRFLTRSVKSQQTNPYVPWAADPSGMLFAPLALFSLVYGRRKKQAAKWEILLLVLLMGGSLVLGLTTVSAHSSQTTAVQAPSVPAAFYTSVQRGETVSGNLPRISGTPNDAPTTTCVISVRGRIVGSISPSAQAVQIYMFTGLKGGSLQDQGETALNQIPIFSEEAITGEFGLEYVNKLYNGYVGENSPYNNKEGTANEQFQNDMENNNTAPKIIYAYSAGCEPAVIYATKLMENKIPVLGIVLIGGPFYCTYDGAIRDWGFWRGEVDSLYNQGVSIMVVNDFSSAAIYGTNYIEEIRGKRKIVYSVWEDKDKGILADHYAYTHDYNGQNELAVNLQEKVFGFTHGVLNLWDSYCQIYPLYKDRTPNLFW